MPIAWLPRDVGIRECDDMLAKLSGSPRDQAEGRQRPRPGEGGRSGIGLRVIFPSLFIS